VTAAADGSVYIAGQTNSFGASGAGLFVVKFDAAGTMVWQTVWDGAAGFAILLQMPFQGCPEGGPIRNAMQLRHIRFAQRGNLRFGQDVLHERIAVPFTALLHIGEFQQIGIEQPLQFLVQDRRHPPRHPMQPLRWNWDTTPS